MNPTLPPTSQQISDNAENLSRLAFAAQGLAPYDQALETPEPAADTFDAVADEKRFMSELLEGTGYVEAVDTGRTALRTEVVIEYVPTETHIDVQVAA